MSTFKRTIDAFQLDPEIGAGIARLLLFDSKQISKRYEQDQLLALSHAIPEFLDAAPELLFKPQNEDMRSLCLLLKQHPNALLDDLSAVRNSMDVFKYCLAVMLTMKVCFLYDKFFHSSHVLRLLLIWRSIDLGDERPLLKCLEYLDVGLDDA